MRRLLGYKWQPGPEEAGSTDVLTEMDPLELGHLAARQGEPGLPWLLQPETLSAATAPARAWHLENRAYALVADPGAEKLALTVLVVPRPHRRQGWGSRMVHALAAAFPGRPWSVSPVLPEGLAAGLFAKLGWETWDINQIEMRLEIGRE